MLILAQSFTFLVILCVTYGQLIRPLQIYKSLIESVYNHLNNSCILLLHANSNPIKSHGLEDAVLLQNLHMHLSSKRHIRTTIMNLETFSKQIGPNYVRIVRPLFVVLNDDKELRRQLINVLTSWIDDMAYPNWLIFFDNNTTIDAFFTGLYVPFDCKFMVSQRNGNEETIIEIYQVEPKAELRKFIFGTWNPKTGIKTPKLNFYLRRNDLFGKTLRIACVDDPPMSRVIHNDQRQTIELEGVIGAMIEILQKSMNFTTTYEEVDDWGIPHRNESRTNLTDMLIKQEVDLVASALVMTQMKKMLIDFTVPLFTTKHHIYIKRPSLAVVKWKGYIAAFHRNVWNSIALLIIITSVIIVFIQPTTNQPTSKNTSRAKDSKQLVPNIIKTCFAVLGAFCNQGMQTSLIDSIRIVQHTVHLTAIVVSSAYAAALVSFLTVQSYSMPFTTMKGLLEDGTYKLGVVFNSPEHAMFVNTADKTILTITENIMEPQKLLPQTYQEGLERLCNEEKYAFMFEDTFIKQYRVENCILEPLKDTVLMNIALGVPKKSPYLGIINSNILKFNDAGILRRIRGSKPIVISKAENKWNSVNIGDVVPLIVLLFGGILIGCLLLYLELFQYRRQGFSCMF